ncbi:MAG: TolC family protein [Aequoribacter sp.]|uniref:TolC family protein n=1 Tax=Aequoribacter sp. TaxID=2847771 RepID=UPI003C3CD6D7
MGSIKPAYKACLRGGFLAITLLALSALADSTDPTLESILAKAVNDHPSILQRLSENEAARSEREIAEWQRYPTVNVSASEANSDISQANTVIQQPLWTGGRITAAINEAEAGVKASDYAVNQAEVLILSETVARFFELERANRSAEIARANVVEHERLFDIIKRRVEAATSPDVDEMLALARLQYAESDAVAFEGAKDSARGALSQLVGEPVAGIAAPVIPKPVMMTRDALLDIALNYAPSMAALGAEKDRFSAQLEGAKAEARPQLALAYDRRFGDLLPGQEQEQLFLQVEYTPGAGFSKRSAIAAARARERGSMQAIEAERRTLTTQIDILWSELQSAYRQRGPAQRLADATAEVVDSYLRQYTVGRKSWLDVLNAQREATQAKYTLVNAETSLMSAHYRLQVLLGQINATSLGVR